MRTRIRSKFKFKEDCGFIIETKTGTTISLHIMKEDGRKILYYDPYFHIDSPKRKKLMDVTEMDRAALSAHISILVSRNPKYLMEMDL